MDFVLLITQLNPGLHETHVTKINLRFLLHLARVICRVFALRVDRSIDGAKSAKIVDVLVADLNISRRAADDHSTFEVLEFQLDGVISVCRSTGSCQFERHYEILRES